MGFLKAFHFAQIDQLVLPISRSAGIFWLIACILFLISGGLYFYRMEWWWMVAVLGIIVSQILVFMYWQDAKFGAIANVVILAGCLLGYGNWSFNTMVKQEKQSLLSSVPKTEHAITGKELKKLPVIVRLWLEKAGITAGTQKPASMHFRQSGEMKTTLDGSWTPVVAEQFVTFENPGFIWIADVKAAPLIYLAGRDKYADGKGEMLIKLLSLIPVADSKSTEIDQGALLRYLAEMVWYPSAALEEYLVWEEVDSTTARATMNYGGITSSGLFEFTQGGEPIRFEAERYYNREEGATMETWVINIQEDSYKTLSGIRVPTKAQVTWKLPEGDFTWYKLEISDLEYNIADK